MAKDQKNLNNYLVLNKYLVSLFGFKHILDFKRVFYKASEGISSDGLYNFTERLLTNSELKPDLKEKLSEYDENIQNYMNQLNKNRNEPIILKYFQYVAILLTEIYLDMYFNNLEEFTDNLITYIQQLNNEEKKTGQQMYPFPNPRSLQKLAYWSATGSGKTYIMHINFMQIQKYSRNNYDNFLLITPNEGLSTQHQQDLELSDIQVSRFDIQRSLDESWSQENQIKIIEITKIKKEISSIDGKSIPVEALGRSNVIFVDEGHKGYSEEAEAWRNIRNLIVENNGFTFEYSATFREITSKDYTFNEYARSIIFDYRYKFFYEDGYGKDFRILNLKNKDDYGDEYLTGSLLVFFEQKLYYQNKKRKLSEFNIENPLMIFVGSSVSGMEKKSDIVKVIEFLARFVNEKNKFNKYIKKIFSGNSTILNAEDKPIFETMFPYLREQISLGELELNKIYGDILLSLFHVKTSKTMQLVEIKNAQGEIGLRFDSDYFGVINIGDRVEFLKYVNENLINKYIRIGSKSIFEDSLFENIGSAFTSINFLIGAKKFIEGWNSFRVSIMGLLNVGKSQGAQIIQLFGRGIRLRGYKKLLKRSSALSRKLLALNIEIPQYITILETLSIFGMNSNYMESFRKDLEEEEILNYNKVVLSIKSTLPNQTLYIPRTSADYSEFEESINIINFNQDISSIFIDLSSKVKTLESVEKIKHQDVDSEIGEYTIDENVISLLNFDEIYLELLKYKKLKNYNNLYLRKSDLKELLSKKNYSLHCKKSMLEITEIDDFKKISDIQRFTLQLFKTYLDKVMIFEKSKFFQSNLQLETISVDDKYLFPREYIFTFNSNVKLLNKTENEISEELRVFLRKNSEEEEKIYEKNIPFKIGLLKLIDFYSINFHLYQPLIFMKTKKNEEAIVKVSPVNLVESELEFIILLEKYLEIKKNQLDYDEIFLLRNPPMKGIGFFEIHNFYPDFILWTIKNKQQSITFVEPHGLHREKLNSEKINLSLNIKDIEKALIKDTNIPINLNSFIFSPTAYNEVNHLGTKKALEKKNVLFLEDKIESIDKMFKIISSI